MLEDKARQIATTAHNGQYRHDGTTPYITHPEAVVGLLKSIGVTDDDILSAAWLHDTIEDCGLTVETLECELNPNIARIVQALTRNIERQEYKDRIRTADYAVQIVKLADVVHNCATLHAGLPPKTIQNKVDDCKALYFELAKRIAPTFYTALQESLKPWQTMPEAR
ncbi:bifunctional (p)ppGpp synthetase/guanosine-3',5'-bis(diphosphate) 3'-pyrophosphohydrolase [Candidatus Woesearchaeota archaeon]|nr:bifunctional (p)ppGpp synthetase/guanosine-3',5'-bis(diphosphate) 3'-pyrophosphohydrolase [Candidatus Woesearchaeota archaeon]